MSATLARPDKDPWRLAMLMTERTDRCLSGTRRAALESDDHVCRPVPTCTRGPGLVSTA
jgi:hypothetical protein